MEKKARKFSTAADEKNYAYCPFKLSKLVEAPGDAPKHHAGIELQAIQGRMQISPFSPQGRFQTGQSMNLLYFVQPRKAWFSMTRYNSAVLNGFRYNVDDFVHVSNGTDDDWIAKVLEIRAVDERHVYVRVYWMYAPNDLPSECIGKGQNRDRHPQFQCQREVVASNHMDIISVLSIVRAADVQQLHSLGCYTKQEGFFWRFAFNYLSSELSLVDPAESDADCPVLPPARRTARSDPPTASSLPFSTSDAVDRSHHLAQAQRHQQSLKQVAEKAQSGQSFNGRQPRREKRRRRTTGIHHGHLTPRAPATPSIGGTLTRVRTALEASASPPASASSLSRLHVEAPPMSPFRYSLLANLQHVLEAGCYQFARRAMPDLLEREMWHCAEAVELNHWARKLRKSSAMRESLTNRSRNDLLLSIASIRHTAVHRLRVSTQMLGNFFDDAETLLRLLGEDKLIAAVSALRCEAQLPLSTLSCSGSWAESQDSEALRIVAIKRAHALALDARTHNNLHSLD